jgi:SAM-dependent methyltransferase
VESASYNAAAQARYDFVLALARADVAPPARVVELGAAPGEQSLRFARAGYDVTAVDLGIASDDWEGAPSGTMEQAFAHAGIELVLWDLDKQPYPLPDKSFDLVVMTEVLEHLREYPAHALAEVRRILRPGGRLYLTTPNAAYVRNRFRLVIGRSVMTPLHDWIGGLPHARHAREYTFAEVRELLVHAGLEPRLVTSRHFHIQSGRVSGAAVLGKRGLDMMARARPTLGPSIVAVSERPHDDF